MHFREPGFSYKETIATGSRAAAAGGFTAVCAVPNLNPVPDSPKTLKIQQDIIDRGRSRAGVSVRFHHCWRNGTELVPMAAMRDDATHFPVTAGEYRIRT